MVLSFTSLELNEMLFDKDMFFSPRVGVGGG